MFDNHSLHTTGVLGVKRNSLVSERHLSAVIVTTTLLFVLVELYFSRFHFLDDAFIHLRIAHQLLAQGHYSFNGADANYATSSPVYTLLLSLVSLASTQPMLPKWVNFFIYFVLLYLIIRQLRHSANAARTLLLIASLLIIASPFAIRWLTDGMESGLVVLLAILLAFQFHKLSQAVALDSKTVIVTGLLSVCAVLLRVEFGYILAVGIAAISTRIMRQQPESRGLQLAFLRCLPILFGGIIATCILFAIFGHLLPDTAVAKQSHLTDQHPLTAIKIVAQLKAIASAHAPASFFGVGLFILWLISVLVSYRAVQGQDKLLVLVVNLALPLFILLLIISQQKIQGIRYFLFVETFLIALNIISLPIKAPVKATFHALNRRYIAAVLVAALLWIVGDAILFYKICEGRSATYLRFANVDYSYLNEHYGIAWDVGMVGYFTQGNILDINGLVNGREFASLSKQARLEKALKNPITFIFANQDQLDELVANQASHHLQLSQWVTVGEFNFPNFRGAPDTHYLLIHPSVRP